MRPFLHRVSQFYKIILFESFMVVCTDKLNMELINPFQCVSMCVLETAVLSVNITNNKNDSRNLKYFSIVGL